MAQLRAVVHGRVQNVSFRAYASDEARKLRLSGWVRNEADGTVQVNAVGPRSALDALLAWLWQGSPLAGVTQVEYIFQDIENETFDGFTLRR